MQILGSSAPAMGECIAHDTDLKRDVAIKVLPDAVARDAELDASSARRSPRVPQSPNMRIHGLQRATATALVMELVAGATL